MRALDAAFGAISAAERVLGKGPNAAQRAAVLALSGLVGMAEVNKIIASVRLPDSADIAPVFGFAPWKTEDTFEAWATVSATVPVQAWLMWHAACDLLFIAGYAILLATSYPPGHSKRTRFTRWLVVLVAVDLVEDGLSVVAAGRLPDQATSPSFKFAGGVWLEFLPWATGLKWLVAAVVVVSLLYAWWQVTRRFTAPKPGAITGQWSELWIAVRMQRFSVLLVGILAIFLLAPGGDLLDQIPDIERTWMLSGWDWHSISHGFIAAAGATLLWLALWCLGRMRTARAHSAYELGQAQPHPNRPLSVIVAVAGYLALALILDRTGWAQVEWTTVWITAGVLMAIPLGSAALRRVKTPADYPEWPKAPGVWLTVRTLGDRLAVWSFALFSLSLIRSSVGPLMLTTAETALPLAVIAPLGFGIACWIVGIVGRQRETSTPSLPGALDGEMHGAVKAIRALVKRIVGVVGWLSQQIKRVAGSRPMFRAGARWAHRIIGAVKNWVRTVNDWMDGLPPPAALSPSITESPTAGDLHKRPTPPGAVHTQDAPADQQLSGSLPEVHSVQHSSPLNPETQQYLLTAAVIMGLAAALLLGLFLFDPIGTADTIGALAVLICGFLILAALYAVATAMVQHYRPARVFRIVGIRATPVITLLLLLGVVVPQFQQSDTLHAARHAAANNPEAHTAAAQWANGDLGADLTAWMSSTGDGSTASCAIPIPAVESAVPASTPSGQQRQVRVMPLAIVGAAGGGARAAWWTVAAMTQLKNSPCAAHSVFLASGASGGSMGLATMLAAADATAAAETLVTPAALSAAVDGLVIRDMIAGFSGLNFAASGAPADAPYPDRSVLMETVWSHQVPGFAQPFPLLPSGTPAVEGRQPANVPWHTLFNMTSAISGCKVVISDVDLRDIDKRPAQPITAQVGPSSEAPVVGAASTSCGTSDDPLPATSNLYVSNPCQRGMPLVTAALMSSRFPFVTPSGVVGGEDGDCGPRDQLIDGGYSENSAIGTAADVVALLMPAVRAHNAGQLTDHPTQPTLVVPVVISVENKPRPIVGSSADGVRVSESFVPIFAGIRKSERLSDTVAQIERALEMTGDWCGGGADCPALETAVTTALDGRTVVVVPYRAPQVIAPLGWILSPAVRESLDYSMRANLECNGGMATPDGVPALHGDDCPTTAGAFGHYLRQLAAQDAPP